MTASTNTTSGREYYGGTFAFMSWGQPVGGEECGDKGLEDAVSSRRCGCVVLRVVSLNLNPNPLPCSHVKMTLVYIQRHLLAGHEVITSWGGRVFA